MSDLPKLQCGPVKWRLDEREDQAAVSELLTSLSVSEGLGVSEGAPGHRGTCAGQHPSVPWDDCPPLPFFLLISVFGDSPCIFIIEKLRSTQKMAH